MLYSNAGHHGGTQKIKSLRTTDVDNTANVLCANQFLYVISHSPEWLSDINENTASVWPVKTDTYHQDGQEEPKWWDDHLDFTDVHHSGHRFKGVLQSRKDLNLTIEQCDD